MKRNFVSTTHRSTQTHFSQEPKNKGKKKNKLKADEVEEEDAPAEEEEHKPSKKKEEAAKTLKVLRRSRQRIRRSQKRSPKEIK
jgi:hypothetical protein